MTAPPTAADAYGADGCPGGWLVVRWPASATADASGSNDGSSDLEVFITPRLGDLLARLRPTDHLAIDIPIGLADHVTRGGRGCDTAARRLLGERQSALFAVPSRAAVMAASYVEACATAFATSDPPRKVSKQCYNIFPKIREADRLLTPALQERVVECHPEVAFCAMNGWRPLALPKKVKSRPAPEGLDLRRNLLSEAGFPVAALVGFSWPARLAGADDLLDAAACAWTARRRIAGNARRFPDEPMRDRRGLRMEIWA
ncbi:MAG: DUF429 domain-containing protein [Rhizobiales bacterium]|nr:DUF429 domain-containing protein [Hyphomicrobiales bacterium]